MLRAATAGCVATPRDSWALVRKSPGPPLTLPSVQG